MRQRGYIPLPLILYGVAGVAIIGLLAWMYNAVESRGYERAKVECEAAARAQRAEEQKRGSAASTKLEKGNAKAKVVYRTITKEVDKIVDRPVYRNVCFDADGLRHANAALRGENTPTGEPDKPLPDTKPAGGWFRGLRPEKAN